MCLPLSNLARLFQYLQNQAFLGTISGNTFSISGDILPGSGHGGSQVFTGSISGNYISGSITGTVMVKDY